MQHSSEDPRMRPFGMERILTALRVIAETSRIRDRYSDREFTVAVNGNFTEPANVECAGMVYHWNGMPPAPCRKSAVSESMRAMVGEAGWLIGDLGFTRVTIRWPRFMGGASFEAVLLKPSGEPNFSHEFRQRVEHGPIHREMAERIMEEAASGDRVEAAGGFAHRGLKEERVSDDEIVRRIDRDLELGGPDTALVARVRELLDGSGAGASRA